MELALFEAIKAALCNFVNFYYFNFKQLLCFDFDVFKYGISIKVYYIEESALNKICDENGKVTKYLLYIVI